MLQPEHFLTDGGGQKGPQLTVLRPGKYRLNQYLFAIELHKVPLVHVAGGQSLEGAAAVLGAASNLSALIDSGNTKD